MRYILKAYEMKNYDRDTSERIGIPSMVLMERAALSVTESLREQNIVPQKVLVAAGMGNNGGDGLAVGRLLAQKGAEVTFYMIGDQNKMTGETRRQLSILSNLGFSIQSKLKLAEYDMVVDALFGIGLSRNVEGEYLELIEKINELGKKGSFILSLDIPSGVCADTGRVLGKAVKADLTVTFAYAKRGHFLYPGREYTGKLIVKDIGITENSFLGKRPGTFCYEKKDLPKLLPKRKAWGNKGTFGKVLLVAGSHDMCGACIFCGKSILKAGAGMVKIITPSSNRVILQGTFPEAMLYTFEEMPSMDKVENALDWADVVVAGPGLGMGNFAKELMKCILKDKRCTMVIDADGLNLLAAHQELFHLAKERGDRGLVITPHPGELVRLMKTNMEEYKENRERLIFKLAKQLRCVVAAKDAVTFVAESGRDEIYMNISGNDGMATAGSGDVLAGVVGGLLAQGMDCFSGTCLGVYLHGLAGEEASAKNGHYGMIASDLVEEIPTVMASYCDGANICKR